MKCPICQKPITLRSFNAIEKQGHCEHEVSQATYNAGIWLVVDYSDSIINYVMNLMVDDVMFGYDSSRRPKNHTQISIMSRFTNDNTLTAIRPIIDIDRFTPLYEDTKLYEQDIRRILNLKAFL